MIGDFVIGQRPVVNGHLIDATVEVQIIIRRRRVLSGANADVIGTLRILEAVRLLGLTKKTKVYQASTSELYGLVQEVPQSEKTPFYPRSPYAVAKMYAYGITVNYREA